VSDWLVGALLLWAASVAGAVWWGYERGQEHELAIQAREDRAAAVATGAAASAAARAIAKIDVKQVTIRQQLEREVREKTVFRDCHSGHDAVRLLNALPAIDPASAPFGGELPASGAAR